MIIDDDDHHHQTFYTSSLPIGQETRVAQQERSPKRRIEETEESSPNPVQVRIIFYF